MCRVASTSLAAEATAASAARRWAAGLLDTWALHDVGETVALLLSEIVTNAVVHAASTPTVRLAVAEGCLEVAVEDRDPRPVGALRPATGSATGSGAGDPLEEAGRGLVLVDALADEWGTKASASGKEVWFRVAVDDWADNRRCGCSAATVGGAPLASGRRVAELSPG